MKNYLYILILSTAFFLSSCDSDNSAAEPKAATTNSDLFAFVPADTPYLMASLEGPPEAWIEASLASTKPMIGNMQEFLNEMLKASTTDDEAGAESTALTTGSSFDIKAFAASLLNQYADNLSIEGLKNLGLDPTAQSVVYGLGPFPVARMSILDPQALRSTLDKAFAAAGETPAEKEMNGRKYWQVGDEKITLIASIGTAEVSFGLIPSNLIDEALANILGQSKPDNAMDAGAKIAKFNRQNGYTNHSSGWFKPEKFMNLFLNDNSSAASSFRGLLKIQDISITPVCEAEITAMVATVPLIHFGSSKLDRKEMHLKASIELDKETASELHQLTIDNVLNTSYSSSPFSFGFAMNLAKAREWLLATAKEKTQNPYQCAELAHLNTMYTAAYEGLNRPLPPLMGNLFGFNVGVDELDLESIMGQGNPIPKGKFLFSIITSNPQMLISMGQMFLPAVAAMNLTPGGDPEVLKLDGMAAITEPAWAAMSDSALGIAFGEGMDSQLLPFLSGGESKSGEFFTFGMSSKLLVQLMDHISKIMPESENMSTTDMEIFKASMDMYEDTFFKASLTDKGIVFEQQYKLK